TNQTENSRYWNSSSPITPEIRRTRCAGGPDSFKSSDAQRHRSPRREKRASRQGAKTQRSLPGRRRSEDDFPCASQPRSARRLSTLVKHPAIAGQVRTVGKKRGIFPAEAEVREGVNGLAVRTVDQFEGFWQITLRGQNQRRFAKQPLVLFLLGRKPHPDL